MIVRKVQATFYRVHSPRWAHLPTSGAGAAKEGGRLNRKGVEALYVSADPSTALAEYKQASPFLPPGTIVSYEITLQRVVDFTGGFDPAQWHPLWLDFAEDWRAAVANGIEPITWQIYDLVEAADMQGVLFRSQAHPGGINLVIYNATLTAADTLRVYDPRGDLPQTQASWQ